MHSVVSVDRLIDCLVQVDAEKRQCEEMLSRSATDRAPLDQSLRHLEADNTQLQRQLQALQTQLAQAEHDHTITYAHIQAPVSSVSN